jgi:ribosome-associated protein
MMARQAPGVDRGTGRGHHGWMTDDGDAPGPARRSDDLVVSGSLRIPAAELDVRFSTSGGPGGQHANKAATRVEIRFDVDGSPSLTPHQRERLLERLGATVRVVVDEHRSQTRNKTVALERLGERLAAALRTEAPRRPTRPGRGAKERRLQAKRQRGETKAGRRRPHDDG